MDTDKKSFWQSVLERIGGFPYLNSYFQFTVKATLLHIGAAVARALATPVPILLESADDWLHTGNPKGIAINQPSGWPVPRAYPG
jgi:hypothetical protein